MSERSSSAPSGGGSPLEQGSGQTPVPEIGPIRPLPEPGSPQHPFAESGIVEQTTRQISPEQLRHLHEKELKELEHKQLQERADSEHRRQADIRNWWAMVVAASVLMAAFLLALFLHPDAEMRKAAANGALSIFLAIMSFIAGRTSARPG